MKSVYYIYLLLFCKYGILSATDCQSYYDANNMVIPTKRCHKNSSHSCCGACNFRYCCKTSLPSSIELDQSKCENNYDDLMKYIQSSYGEIIDDTIPGDHEISEYERDFDYHDGKLKMNLKTFSVFSGIFIVVIVSVIFCACFILIVTLIMVQYKRKAEIIPQLPNAQRSNVPSISSSSETQNTSSPIFLTQFPVSNDYSISYKNQTYEDDPPSYNSVVR